MNAYKFFEKILTDKSVQVTAGNEPPLVLQAPKPPAEPVASVSRKLNPVAKVGQTWRHDNFASVTIGELDRLTAWQRPGCGAMGIMLDAEGRPRGGWTLVSDPTQAEQVATALNSDPKLAGVTAQATGPSVVTVSQAKTGTVATLGNQEWSWGELSRRGVRFFGGEGCELLLDAWSAYWTLNLTAKFGAVTVPVLRGHTPTMVVEAIMAAQRSAFPMRTVQVPVAGGVEIKAGDMVSVTNQGRVEDSGQYKVVNFSCAGDLVSQQRLDERAKAEKFKREILAACPADLDQKGWTAACVAMFETKDSRVSTLSVEHSAAVLIGNLRANMWPIVIYERAIKRHVPRVDSNGNQHDVEGRFKRVARMR